jgi:hypothetical protein
VYSLTEEICIAFNEYAPLCARITKLYGDVIRAYNNEGNENRRGMFFCFPLYQGQAIGTSQRSAVARTCYLDGWRTVSAYPDEQM